MHLATVLTNFYQDVIKDFLHMALRMVDLNNMRGKAHSCRDIEILNYSMESKALIVSYFPSFHLYNA